MKKAQFSLEFLMSYGWILIAVMVSILVLTTLGVLDFSKILPDECNFPLQLKCYDYAIDSEGDLKFTLMNAYGKDIEDFGIDLPKFRQKK